MATVIHHIKGGDYAYDHHRVPGVKNVVSSYIGPVSSGGRGRAAAHGGGAPRVLVRGFKGLRDERIRQYIAPSPWYEKQRLTREFEERLRNSPERFAELKFYDAKIKAGETTKSLHTKNHQYFQKRKELHNKIIAEIIDHKKSETQPEAVFFGGPTASGKSKLMSRVKGNGKNYVYINNDEIKKKLPEYTGAAAGYVHEEARDIADETLALALVARKNIIIDSSLRDVEKSKKLFDAARNSGYKVTLLSNVVPLEVSVHRASDRFLNPLNEGRFVPINRIISEHDKTNKAQFELIKHADSGKIFDSDVPKDAPLKVLVSK